MTGPVCAVGVVVVRDMGAGSEILLIRRANPPNAGSWSFPGGRQNWGETLEAAARRELLEETALTAGDLTLVAAVDIFADDPAAHYVVIDYATRWQGDVAVAGDDAAEASWCGIATLAERAVTPEIVIVATRAALVMR